MTGRLSRWAAVLSALLLAVATGVAGAWVASANPAEMPLRLHIAAIGVDAPVSPVGTVMAAAPFLGGQSVSTFDVPPDGSTVGWWSDGPMVGAGGMAIVLGHTMVGGPAVFNRLGDLKPGDAVAFVGRAGAPTINFRITSIFTGIDKTRPDALQRVLSDNAATAQLALITCGGAFDETIHASADNIVAFATSA